MPKPNISAIPEATYHVMTAARPIEHGKGVMIDVAGLQLDDAPGHIDDAGSDAVGPEPVDDGAIAALPEQAAEPEGRTHENRIIEFVEIPFVEQEFVERPGASREPYGDFWRDQI